MSQTQTMPRLRTKESDGEHVTSFKGQPPKYMMNVETREIVAFKQAHLIKPLAGRFVPYRGKLPLVDPMTGTVRLPDEWTGNPEDQANALSREERVRLIAAQMAGVPKEELLDNGMPSKLAIEKRCGFKVDEKDRKDAFDMFRGKTIKPPPPIEMEDAEEASAE